MYGLQPDGTPIRPNVQSNSELSGAMIGKNANRLNHIHMNPNSHQNNQGMAYVNISSDGAKPVGPIGLKRAEKELIMRRYNSKYHHNHNEQINRVALIYGQQTP